MVRSRLFTDRVGWLSFPVIAFVVVMGVWFAWHFDREMAESAAEEARRAAAACRPVATYDVRRRSPVP